MTSTTNARGGARPHTGRLGASSVAASSVGALNVAGSRLGRRTARRGRVTGGAAALGIALAGLVGAPGLVGPAGAVPRAGTVATAKPKPPPDLIADPGAEASHGDNDGDVVKVPGWTVTKGDQFTAVPYGASGFPEATSPGPKVRGKEFFAGGPSAARSVGTQKISLTRYGALIRSGAAHFALTGWLGGFSDQRDHAALTVTWESQAGEALSHATIGPVSPGQRRNTSGTLYRATSGVVPRTATTAVVSLVLTREDGVYDDGYADNLGLTIARRA
jgi:hypothetical protein